MVQTDSYKIQKQIHRHEHSRDRKKRQKQIFILKAQQRPAQQRPVSTPMMAAEPQGDHMIDSSLASDLGRVSKSDFVRNSAKFVVCRGSN